MTDLFDQEPALAPDALRRRVVRGSAYTAAGQIVRVVLSLASQVALARIISPADFGLVAMVGPIIALVELFKDLGITQSIVQKDDLTLAEVNSLYWIGIALSIACAISVCLLSPVAALVYHRQEVVPLAIALSLQMPL